MAKLLDDIGYDTTDGRKSLRNTGGTLGINSVADTHYISTYDHQEHQHHNVLNKHGDEVAFTREEDARDFINQHNKNLKSQMIVDERPPASIGEMEQAAKNRIRRYKEKAKGV